MDKIAKTSVPIPQNKILEPTPKNKEYFFEKLFVHLDTHIAVDVTKLIKIKIINNTTIDIKTE
ncbi:MAG: hypothetical protein K2L64_00550 [Ureaplasma sp.]|nr:hypothetical protein [Ureaplasma sp.]